MFLISILGSVYTLQRAVTVYVINELKITIHKTITTQIRPVKLLITKQHKDWNNSLVNKMVSL